MKDHRLYFPELLFAVPQECFGYVQDYSLNINDTVDIELVMAESPLVKRVLSTAYSLSAHKKELRRRFNSIPARRPWRGVENFPSLVKLMTSSGIELPDHALQYISIAWRGRPGLFTSPSQDDDAVFIRRKETAILKRDSMSCIFDKKMHEKLTFMEGLYQTLRGAVITTFVVNRRISRFMRRKVPGLILKNPDLVHKQLKAVAMYADRKFFGAELPSLDGNPFRVLIDQSNHDHKIIHLRFMARCLPHSREAPTEDSYIERVSSPPTSDPSVELDFHEWIGQQAKKSKPVKTISFNPSCSGSFETTGTHGGQSSQYHDIILYQLARVRAERQSKFDAWAKDDQFVRSLITQDAGFPDENHPLAVQHSPKGTLPNWLSDAFLSYPSDGFKKRMNEIIKEVKNDPDSGYKPLVLADKANGINVDMMQFAPSFVRYHPRPRSLKSQFKDSSLVARPEQCSGSPTVQGGTKVSSVPYYAPKRFEKRDGCGLRDWEIARARAVLLIAGSLNLLKTMESPMLVTVTPDRNGKYRIPTMTWVPALVTAGLLRDVADHFCRSDVRLNGHKLKNPRSKLVRPRNSKFIRSQDLSFATDNHSFNLTRGYYERIFQEIPGAKEIFPFWEDVLDALLPKQGGRPLYVEGPSGPRVRPKINIQEKIEEDRMFMDLYLWKPKLFERCGIHPNTRNKNQFPAKRPVLRTLWGSEFTYHELDGIILDFETQYEDCWETNGYTLVARALKGPAMGEPLAFPVMSAVSTFSYERSHRGFKNAYIVNVGDDSQFLTSKKRSDEYDRIIQSLGCLISKEKDSLHPTRGVFVEIVTDNLQTVGYPFAPLYAIGSGKTKPNYYTAGPSAVALYEKTGARKAPFVRALRGSRFQPEIRYLHKRGLPVHAPSFLFGLGFPDTYGSNFLPLKVDCYEQELRIGDPLDPSLTKHWRPENKSRLRILQSAASIMKLFIDEEFSGKAVWDCSSATNQLSSSAFALSATSGTALLEQGRKTPFPSELLYLFNRVRTPSRSEYPVRRGLQHVVESFERKRRFPLPDFFGVNGEACPLGLGISMQDEILPEDSEPTVWE